MKPQMIELPDALTIALGARIGASAVARQEVVRLQVPVVFVIRDGCGVVVMVLSDRPDVTGQPSGSHGRFL